MTNKIQKIREKVEIAVNRRLNLLNGDYFDLNEETDGFTNEIMDIIDSMQEEPKTDWLQELQERLDSLSKEDFKKVFDKYAVDAIPCSILGKEIIYTDLPKEIEIGNKVKVIIIKEE